MAAGCSGKPLADKRGIKAGMRILVLDDPGADYHRALGSLPAGAELTARAGKNLDLIRFFTVSKAGLARKLPGLASRITPSGAIWVSWPKKSAKLPTASGFTRYAPVW